METIKIKISKACEIEYEVAGVKGKKCKDLTKAIDTIAGKVLSTKITGEYCAVETENKHLTNKDN